MMENEPYANLAELKAAYAERYPRLKHIAEMLAKALHDILDTRPRVDQIAVRVKSLDRVLEKSQRMGYTNPLEEVLDQIGTRVVVYYNSDVEPTAQAILTRVRLHEQHVYQAPDPRIFGYQGKHFICYLPPEIHACVQSPVDFFELQVSTLFQHAWAEAEHELGYKAELPLEYDAKRKIAWAAAQAWGADTIFDDIWRARHSAESSG
jgi:ppGpp synthetase/RelA/SpoT-type nucleotidyltranferase